MVNPVTFKDLCIDTQDPAASGPFWAAVLGLEPAPNGPAVVLKGETPGQTVWINVVEESKLVKNRVHLDVNTAEVADLEQLGAVILDHSHAWTVMTDPEGGEFCAFVRPADTLKPYRLYEIVVDSADPERMATWWAERYGVEAQHEADDPFWWIQDVPGMPCGMVFVGVPEPKQVKNRVHWDVLGHTPDLLATGARLLRARDDEIQWDVLADPEGNEFCVFSPTD